LVLKVVSGNDATELTECVPNIFAVEEIG